MGSRDAATENDRATVSRTKGQPQQTMVRASRIGPSGQRLNPSRTKHFGSAKRERLTPDRSLDGIVHKGRDHPREQRAPRPRREPLPREIRGRIPIDILALALRERGIGRPDLHDSPAPEPKRRQRSRFRIGSFFQSSVCAIVQQPNHGVWLAKAKSFGKQQFIVLSAPGGGDEAEGDDALVALRRHLAQALGKVPAPNQQRCCEQSDGCSSVIG